MAADANFQTNDNKHPTKSTMKLLELLEKYAGHNPGLCNKVNREFSAATGISRWEVFRGRQKFSSLVDAEK